jgi:hypothetical protein
MTDHPESLYQLVSPPTPKGYWILQQSSYGRVQFAVHKKPNKLHRFMTKLLLGWDWVDCV